jgi:hypothetical protein
MSRKINLEDIRDQSLLKEISVSAPCFLMRDVGEQIDTVGHNTPQPQLGCSVPIMRFLPAKRVQVCYMMPSASHHRNAS